MSRATNHWQITWICPALVGKLSVKINVITKPRDLWTCKCVNAVCTNVLI